jgi:PAS domain S-box-containing protein
MELAVEEWKIKGKLLQELDALRGRVAQLEQAIQGIIDEQEETRPSFRWFFDGASEGMLLLDLVNKQFIAGNKAICRMLGWNPEDIRNLKLKDVYSKRDLDHVIKAFEKQTNRESVLIRNVPVRKKDGNIIFADITSVPLTLSGRRHIISILKETPSKKVKWIPQQDASNDSYASQHLTMTELKVLRLIAHGMRNKEIAQLFHRSPRTIENHRAHLMKKLGVDSSVELVTRAIELGIVPKQA